VGAVTDMKRLARILFPLAVGALIPRVFLGVVALTFMTPGFPSAYRWLKTIGMPMQLTMDLSTNMLPLVAVSYVAGRIVFGTVLGHRPLQILLCSAGWFEYVMENVYLFCFTPGMSCANPSSIFNFAFGLLLVPLGLALALVGRKRPPDVDSHPPVPRAAA
jgi:hypothetical protein